MTIRDCLALLDIRDTPTKIVIKKAFRHAALQKHPDKNGSDAEFKKLKAAYDTLMSYSDEELVRYSKKNSSATPRATKGAYDPFEDPDYDERVFFEPENPRTAQFEQYIRAKGCRHCKGLGYMSKIMDPKNAFLSRERRRCKCQWN